MKLKKSKFSPSDENIRRNHKIIVSFLQQTPRSHCSRKINGKNGWKAQRRKTKSSSEEIKTLKWKIKNDFELKTKFIVIFMHKLLITFRELNVDSREIGREVISLGSLACNSSSDRVDRNWGRENLIKLGKIK